MKKIKRAREQRMMVNCEDCGSRIDAWLIHCVECGVVQPGLDQSDTDCEDCGRSIPLDFVFCTYCGTHTGDEERETPVEDFVDFQMDGEAFDELCESKECGAPLSRKTLHCAICGVRQKHTEDYDDECQQCSAGADSEWQYCGWCGAYGLMGADDENRKRSA